MSTSIASSSRSIFRYTAPKAPQSQARTVIHHARPPRVPVLNSPHTPKTPSPSPGTSTANTSHPVPPQSSYSLENSNLTFHHAPPPSAPSYTTGSVPPLLQWVNGQQVHLTGEEGAPIRKHRRGDGKGPQWDGGVKRQMIEMRSRGMSRGDIAKTLSIPPVEQQFIARVSPSSLAQRAEKEAELEEQKSTWGFNKRLARAKREKRRELW